MLLKLSFSGLLQPRLGNTCLCYLMHFNGHCQIDCKLSRCTSTFSAKNRCIRFGTKTKKSENNDMHFCLKMKLTEISVILGKKRVLLFVDFFCFSAQVK